MASGGNYGDNLRAFHNRKNYVLESRVDGLQKHDVTSDNVIDACKAAYTGLIFAHWGIGSVEYKVEFVAKGTSFVSFVAQYDGMDVYHGTILVTIV